MLSQASRQRSFYSYACFIFRRRLCAERGKERSELTAGPGLHPVTKPVSAPLTAVELKWLPKKSPLYGVKAEARLSLPLSLESRPRRLVLLCGKLRLWAQTNNGSRTHKRPVSGGEANGAASSSELKRARARAHATRLARGMSPAVCAWREEVRFR